MTSFFYFCISTNSHFFSKLNIETFFSSFPYCNLYLYYELVIPWLF